MLPLLDHALDYLSHGYSVIPCNPKTKKPFVKWKPYQTRLPTEGEVCEWWRQWPNAAIGVVTGKVSRLVVLDADVDKHGANVWLLYQCAPTERIVKTGGGYHLWLRYPEGADFVPTLAGVMEKELGPGLDVRGDGGYVIAPPSLHPSGVLYAWVQEGEATALPPAILESLLEQHRHSPQPVTARVDQDDTQTLSDDEQWLTRSLGGVASGSRNQTLTRLAGYLAGKGLPFDVTERLVEVWDDRNDPPLRAEDEAGFRRTLRSVYEREAAKKAAADHAPGGALDFTLIPLDEFMCEYGDSRVQWIVQEWLPWATTGLIISPPAHYKTWFLLDLAVSIASGRPFLGQFPVEKPGPVILFQQEDAFQGLAGRIGLIAGNRLMEGQEVPDDDPLSFSLYIPEAIPVHIHRERVLRFGDRWSMEKLREFVEQIRPRLVILDPLYSATTTEDFMASAAGNMMVLKHLRDLYHTSFLVAHHTRKGAVHDTGREGAWGSQFLNAWLETGWQIRSAEDAAPGEIILRRHFKITGAAETVNVRFDIDSEEQHSYHVHVSAARKDGDKPQDTTDEAILMAIAEAPLSQGRIAEMVGLDKSNVSRRLKRLVEQRRVELAERGLYRAASDLPD
ncbi:MAG: AAA family ATPase [Armatimonadetes bacterium]|nr:AAA family ATPase [Armatimonadota bacterium]